MCCTVVAMPRRSLIHIHILLQMYVTSLSLSIICEEYRRLRGGIRPQRLDAWCSDRYTTRLLSSYHDRLARSSSLNWWSYSLTRASVAGSRDEARRDYSWWGVGIAEPRPEVFSFRPQLNYLHRICETNVQGIWSALAVHMRSLCYAYLCSWHLRQCSWGACLRENLPKKDFSKAYAMHTRMHGFSAHTGFPRTLTMTNYLSALLSKLNPILSVANLSRLKCAETQCARKSHAYE